MNILVIDTATEACSVAIQLGDVVFSKFEICPQQHSQRILPMIDELLLQANIRLCDIDFLAFGQGPGSFTGVRIATGILQGLALGTNLKVVGVSTLAAMAQQACEQHSSKYVCAAIDARMSEVYFAQYELEQGVVKLIADEQVLPPEEAATLINIRNNVGVGTGWRAYPVLNPNQDVTVIDEILYPNATFMLPLAKQLIDAGKAVEVEDIQPVYLRDKVTWKKLPGRE